MFPKCKDKYREKQIINLGVQLFVVATLEGKAPRIRDKTDIMEDHIYFSCLT